MMNPRGWFRLAVLAFFAVVAAAVSAGEPSPKTIRTKSTGVAIELPATELAKFAAWDDQCRAGTFDIRSAAGIQPEGAALEYLKLHAVCASFVPSRANACADSFTAIKDFRRGCRSGKVMAALIQASAAGEGGPGGNVEAICKELADDFPSEDRSSMVRVCGVLASVLRKGQGLKVLCNQVRESLPDMADDCASYFSFVDGTSKRCKKDNKECAEWAQLVAALRSGQKKDCAVSPFCEVFSSRDIRACEPYLSRANKAFCADAALLVRGGQKPQSFKKGESMQMIPPDVQKQINKLDAQGRTGKQP